MKHFYKYTHAKVALLLEEKNINYQISSYLIKQKM